MPACGRGCQQTEYRCCGSAQYCDSCGLEQWRAATWFLRESCGFFPAATYALASDGRWCYKSMEVAL